MICWQLVAYRLACLLAHGGAMCWTVACHSSLLFISAGRSSILRPVSGQMSTLVPCGFTKRLRSLDSTHSMKLLRMSHTVQQLTTDCKVFEYDLFVGVDLPCIHFICSSILHSLFNWHMAEKENNSLQRVTLHYYIITLVVEYFKPPDGIEADYFDSSGFGPESIWPISETLYN